MAAGRAHESGEVRKKIETAEERVVHLLRVHGECDHDSNVALRED